MARRAKDGRPLVAAVAAAAILAASLAAAPAAHAAPLAPAALSPAAALVPFADGDSCHEGAPTYIKLDDGLPTSPLMQVAAAHRISTGAGVTIAIVDSGINGADPRLKHALVDGINLVPDGTDPNGLTDTYSHGTALAGQISAAPRDDSSLVGLAPDAKLMSVRVYADISDKANEAGFGIETNRLAQGIRAAADAGAQIINVSISTESASDTIDAAVAYATERGSLVVASAGNASGGTDLTTGSEATTQTRYPAGSPGALGVTATTVPENVVTDASVHGPQVDLAAPGQHVVSLGLNTGDCSFAGDGPGTSFATAYVSAIAALVASAHPDETPEQWAFRLTSTALRANPDARNDVYGWGLVQPFQALTLVVGPETRGPQNPFFHDEADVLPAPVPRKIAPPSTQHETDLDRALLIGVSSAGILAFVGTITAFRNRRRAGAS